MKEIVTPAKAGVPGRICPETLHLEIPAFAGMTEI